MYLTNSYACLSTMIRILPTFMPVLVLWYVSYQLSCLF